MNVSRLYIVILPSFLKPNKAIAKQSKSFIYVIELIGNDSSIVLIGISVEASHNLIVWSFEQVITKG